MEHIAVEAETATIRLTESELVLINNALNEVVNGVPFSDADFQTRLGHTRSEGRKLLAEVSATHASLRPR